MTKGELENAWLVRFFPDRIGRCLPVGHYGRRGRRPPFRAAASASAASPVMARQSGGSSIWCRVQDSRTVRIHSTVWGRPCATRSNVAAVVQIMASAQRAEDWQFHAAARPCTVAGGSKGCATRTLGRNVSPTRARLPDIQDRPTARCRQAHCSALAGRWRRTGAFASSQTFTSSLALRGMARSAVGLRLPGGPAALAGASATGLYWKSGDRRAMGR